MNSHQPLHSQPVLCFFPVLTTQCGTGVGFLLASFCKGVFIGESPEPGTVMSSLGVFNG